MDECKPLGGGGGGGGGGGSDSSMATLQPRASVAFKPGAGVGEAAGAGAGAAGAGGEGSGGGVLTAAGTGRTSIAGIVGALKLARNSRGGRASKLRTLDTAVVTKMKIVESKPVSVGPDGKLIDGSGPTEHRGADPSVGHHSCCSPRHRHAL